MLARDKEPNVTVMLKREVDAATGGKIPFWCTGAGVGMATAHGLKNVVAPEWKRGTKVWPFDGGLHDLVAGGASVIAETYPKCAYRVLGFGLRGKVKDHEARAAAGRRGIDTLRQTAVELTPELRTALSAGFRHDGGDDSFDAAVGAILMALIALGHHSAGDPCALEPRQVEGWMLGVTTPW